MKLKPLISGLEEVRVEGSTQYVLTMNGHKSVCPFYGEIQQEVLPCSTICPHFVIDTDRRNKESYIHVTLSCGNGNAFHDIKQVLNLKDNEQDDKNVRGL